MTAVVPPAPTAEVLSPFETGPDTPAGKYLRSFWQPVKLSEELPVGRVQPLRVMSEDFTIYRGVSGTVVLTQAGCPHRQTMLAIGNVEGDSIRCSFHGWKFGADGRCQDAPGQGPRLVERMKIRTYPTREEYGVVFAYFGDGEPPAFFDIDGFSKEHGKDMMSAPIRGTATYRRHCNYYINVENALDLAHVAFTHKLSSDPSITEVGFDPGVVRIRDITVERLEFGVRCVEIEHDAEPTSTIVMLPNAMHLVVAQRDGFLEQVGWRVPIDDERHFSIQITALHTDAEGAERFRAYQARHQALLAKYPPTEDCAEEILRGEKTLYDFADHPDLVNIEDHVVQMGMQFINDPGKENLAQSDKAVLQLRRMFMSRLADFMAGAPTADTGW
ncbi:Rieske 2Fe-2S domain-containing protein [Gordonia sp. TBRC 11910]|uniref:Rieske 2Fe-2S domain-containing protein n=1 Tax=Gordonia asplenii TaxID=2725283 RepID=A0A848L188_9ACTN|nr:Rieske 2Fe-2S domain-containing protein [Gordonia asplenii]NMO04469.1 Rieske 2Fe-2S domain-containing protein [Gordonia asplenii]